MRGLQHAEATGDLTVVELYRHVHRWMTEEAVITPQLKIAGEGDVAIARRPHSPQLAPPTDSAPTPEKIPAQDSTDPTGAARGKVEGAAALEPQLAVSELPPVRGYDRVPEATGAQLDAQDAEMTTLREKMGAEQAPDVPEPGAVVDGIARSATADNADDNTGGGAGEPPSRPVQAPPSASGQTPEKQPQTTSRPLPKTAVITPQRPPQVDRQTNPHTRSMPTPDDPTLQEYDRAETILIATYASVIMTAIFIAPAVSTSAQKGKLLYVAIAVAFGVCSIISAWRLWGVRRFLINS